MWKKIYKAVELLQAAWGILTSAFFQGTIWPVVAAAAAIMIGAAQDIPWLYVYLAAIIAFAGLSTGLLRFDEWRDQRRVVGKLGFLGVRTGSNIEGTEYNLGITVTSMASFDIQYEIVKFETRLRDRVPLELTQLPQKFTVPPRGIGWFSGSLIRLDDIKPNTAEIGFVDYEIFYGRPGRLRYKPSGKKRVILPFDADRNPRSGGDVTDAI